MLRSAVCLILILGFTTEAQADHWLQKILDGGQATSQSSPESIHFDVPSTIHCLDVTTEEFKATRSLEKLLEIRFDVSALVENGSDQQIQELFFLAYSPQQRFRIVQQYPQTDLITEYAAPIDVNESRDNTNSMGLNVTPTFEFAGKAALNANISDRTGENRKISKLPPKQLLVASGTRNRQSGAYFKLKPSSQTTLEGRHEIRLIVRVPMQWRADLMYVHCRGVLRGRTGTSKLSRQDFVVPLHIQNDAAAKSLCNQYVQAESQFRKMNHQVENAETPKALIVSLDRLIGKKEKNVSLPKNWTGKVIFSKDYQAPSGLAPESAAALKRIKKARFDLEQLGR